MSSKFKEKLSCWVAAAVFGLLYLTYRFELIDGTGEASARTIHPNKQCAIAIWHRNSIGCLLACARERLAILVSLSFDGTVIAYVAKYFGIHSARGSSSRGGMEAFKQLLKFHKEGYDLGITVDGPRGPIYKVKSGIIAAAARTGMPILPFAAIARREWVLDKAWDKFRVPKPFTTIYKFYGQPIVVPRGTEASEYGNIAESLEADLMLLERKAQEHIAHLPKR